jgi:hypothetical protein
MVRLNNTTDRNAEILYLHVNLVTTKYNGDVFTHAFEITMPVRNVLVCDTRGDVEHDNTTLSLDIISVTETTEFLLAGSVPDVENDVAEVGGEG